MKDQLLLFNYLSKLERFPPENTFSQSHIKMSRLMSFSNVAKIGNNMTDAYKRVNDGKNSDKTNFRLIELLDQKRGLGEKY